MLGGPALTSRTHAGRLQDAPEAVAFHEDLIMQGQHLGHMGDVAQGIPLLGETHDLCAEILRQFVGGGTPTVAVHKGVRPVAEIGGLEAPDLSDRDVQNRGRLLDGPVPREDLVQSLETLLLGWPQRNAVLFHHARQHGIGTASLTTQTVIDRRTGGVVAGTRAFKGLIDTDKIAAQLYTDIIAAQIAPQKALDTGMGLC